MTDLERFLLETTAFSVSFDGRALFCRFCGKTTNEAYFVERLCCVHCNCFHDNMKLQLYLKERGAHQ